jgi:hypothetical protein
VRPNNEEGDERLLGRGLCAIFMLAGPGPRDLWAEFHLAFASLSRLLPVPLFICPCMSCPGAIEEFLERLKGLAYSKVRTVCVTGILPVFLKSCDTFTSGLHLPSLARSLLTTKTHNLDLGAQKPHNGSLRQTTSSYVVPAPPLHPFIFTN